MEIQHLLKPFEIDYLETDECPCKPHKHTFFELVFIKKGKGFYFMDNNKYAYRESDLFIIVPSDGHYTVVSERTSFLFIRFNKIYFGAEYPKGGIYRESENWAKRLEMIFANQQLVRDSSGSKYGSLMLALMDTLAQEYLSGASNDVLHRQVINTILAIISSYQFGDGDQRSGRSIPLLNYIHENIYDPAKISASSLADHFCISKTYISEYFRKHTGVSMQHYIIEYKLSLAAIRLKHSDMSLAEIAFELGFTDESHLSKTFKKFKNISPSEYRKAV